MKDILIKSNIGPKDKLARYLLGMAAEVGAFWVADRKTKTVLRALGLIAIASAASRYDPLYHLLGISHSQGAYRAFPHVLRRL